MSLALAIGWRHTRHDVDVEFVRLLHVQRDFYRLPRGRERFREYLRTMVHADSGDLELPLVAMNPMGKGHGQAVTRD